MSFHIDLTDFAAKLSKQAGKEIKVRQTAEQQITAQYLMSIKLDLAGHTDNSIQFRYTLPFGANAVLSLFKNLKSKKFTLNTSDKTVWVHLDAFAAYRNEVAGQKITQVHLQNGALVIETEPFPQA